MRWKVLDGLMYFFYGTENTLLMPFPNPPPSKLAEFPDIFNLPRDNFMILQATEKYITENPEIENLFQVEENDELFDYLHRTDRLVELKGAKLAKKKNLVSQFMRANPSYQRRLITSDIYEDCFKFAEKWCEIKTCEHIGITHEKSAIRRAFNHFKDIGLEGIAIFANGSMIAFSVFSRQNPNTYIVHFEKADRNIKGAAQIINWETAKYLSDKCTFINREQDLAIPGLRQAKSSYDPDFLISGKNLRLKI